MHNRLIILILICNIILALRTASASSIDEDISTVKNHGIGNELRYNAAEHLGKSGEKKAIDALISLLSEEEQWTIRRLIVTTLGNTGQAEVVEPLKNVLKRDLNIFVRSDAALSLSKFKVPGVFESLTDALTSDTSVFVRSDTARALGALGDKRAIPFLKKALNDEGVAIKFVHGKEIKSKEVSAAAMASLKVFGEDKNPSSLGDFIKDIKEDTAKEVDDIEKNTDAGKMGWSIQLLSKKDINSMSDLEKKIKDSGYNAYVVKNSIDNNIWYRLRVGPYKTKDDALRQADEISKRFDIKDPWIINLSGDEER